MTLKARHTTAEGRTMLVAEMDNDHLLNTINLALGKVEQIAVEFARIVSASETEDTPYSEAWRIMYDIPKRSAKSTAREYAQTVEMTAKYLAPYIMELFTRNFTDQQNARIGVLRHRWQTVVGRSAPISRSHILPLMLEGVVAPDDE